MALTSFLTGVTEPIEFSFMFLAPVLYGIHALLTGIAMALMQALGVHLGFGFSAGLFDYVLNFSLSTRPILLIPVGLAYFAIYYSLFRYVIVRFDLKTLGRESDDVAAPVADAGAGAEMPAYAWIDALGSAANLRVVEACTTRLRLVVKDAALINERALTSLGSRGVLRLADGAVQVVVGPIADQLATEIREGLRHLDNAVPAAPARDIRPAPAPAIAPAPSPAADPATLAAALAALGGRANIAEVHLSSSRVCVSVRDAAAVNEPALSGTVRAVARPAPQTIHLVLGSQAESWFAGLKLS